MKIPFGEEPLTLDDFLNLLDGVRETPGRIIVLTSNHYDKLDKALTRPGRIDCTIHMQNISHSNLQKMCEFYFGKKMMKRDLEKIKERSRSPAEVINLYTIHKNDMKGFIQSLQIKGTDSSL
jgi:ATP-dependent 26S proteasome regulatory subunit